MPVHRQTTCWAMAAASLLAAPARSADFTGAAGNAEVVWAIGSVTSKTSKFSTLRFRYCGHTQPEFEYPVNVRPVTGQIALLTALGPALHILYEDGSQWRFTPDGLQVVARLPAPDKPLAWAASASDGVVYAIVPGSAFERLPSGRRVSTAPATRTARADEPAGDRGASQAVKLHTDPEPTRVLDHRPLAEGLARFAGGRWGRAGNPFIPKWFDEHRAVWLTVDRDTVHLFFEPGQEGERILHAHRSLAGEDWTDPEPIGVQAGVPGPHAALTVNQRVLFVHAAPVGDDPARIHFQVVHHTGEGWQPGPFLGAADQPRAFPSDGTAVTAFGQHVAVAERTGPREITISTWNPQTGQAVGDERVASLDLPRPPVVGDEMATWLLVATVTLLFFATLRRRRLMGPRSGPRNPSDA